ncbi:650_t:CDS:2 [Cetraspora pellucida]|uniref:647_t:CDS:1 n=2 Tax=Cetraspora pellucida TaxID=1433469 RepID=A0ACA9LGI4_9GLOM|nr:647_t:CDS:2 [Cetraspora pellucida]CAG8524360.1 650_t:CDS:2 [Cetraspora pellucida]
MTIKEKLTQATQEFTTLKQKINAKLQSQQQTITDTNTKLVESNRNLELQMKENNENEKDNMLREEVLREWGELKKKITNSQKNQVFRPFTKPIEASEEIKNRVRMMEGPDIQFRLGQLLRSLGHTSLKPIGNIEIRSMKKSAKSKIKPVARVNTRKGGRMGSTNFTNAEAIKNNFLAHTRGSHNLLEDCQILADFANSVANINNDIQEMTLAVNEQEFNNRKQQLVSKLQGCINKCQTTSATSIGEILQLEVEIKAAEAKYNDAMTKAATETDPAKKAQLIAIAQTAEREIKQAKQKLARNPLSKLAEYNHLHNLGNLITGNLPQNPTTPLNCPDPDGSNPNNSNSGRSSGGRSGGSGQTS